VPLYFDITDAEDIAMRGTANAKAAMAAVDARWNEPKMRRAVAMVLGGMPPEMLQQIQQRHPEAYRRIKEALEKGSKDGT